MIIVLAEPKRRLPRHATTVLSLQPSSVLAHLCLFHALQFRRELLHLRLHLLEGCLGHRAQLWSRKWLYDLSLHRQHSRVIKRSRDGWDRWDRRIESIVPSSHHPSGTEWRPAHRARVGDPSQSSLRCGRKLRDELNVTHHGKVWVVSTLHPATAASAAAAPVLDVVVRGFVVRRATNLFLPQSLLLQTPPMSPCTSRREDIARLRICRQHTDSSVSRYSPVSHMT